MVGDALRSLRYDAVLFLGDDIAPPEIGVPWLSVSKADAGVVVGHVPRIRLHGLADGAKHSRRALGSIPEVHCRITREPEIGHDAELLVWSSAPMDAREASRRSVSRVPLRLEGNHVNVVDIGGDHGRWRVQWQHVPVDGSAGESAVVARSVTAYYRRHALALVDDAGGSRGFWEAKGYADAAQCGECHEPEHHNWQRHLHAAAVDTLKARERLVPDCLPCHSTLYRKTGKFTLDAPGADLSVECATCHGDGVLHSLLGRRDQIVKTPPEKVCRQCHQGDHDPDFDYETAVKKVGHHRDAESTEKP